MSKEPAEDCQWKIEKPKAQFNAANIGIAIRKLIFPALNNADGTVMQRLMLVVRDHSDCRHRPQPQTKWRAGSKRLRYHEQIQNNSCSILFYC